MIHEGHLTYCQLILDALGGKNLRKLGTDGLHGFHAILVWHVGIPLSSPIVALTVQRVGVPTPEQEKGT